MRLTSLAVVLLFVSPCVAGWLQIGDQGVVKGYPIWSQAEFTWNSDFLHLQIRNLQRDTFSIYQTVSGLGFSMESPGSDAQRLTQMYAAWAHTATIGTDGAWKWPLYQSITPDPLLLVDNPDHFGWTYDDGLLSTNTNKYIIGPADGQFVGVPMPTGQYTSFSGIGHQPMVLTYADFWFALPPGAGDSLILGSVDFYYGPTNDIMEHPPNPFVTPEPYTIMSLLVCGGLMCLRRLWHLWPL